MLLYHITPVKNVASILVQGLIPFKGCGFVYRDTQRELRKLHGNVVWLTDDVDFIFETQLTPEWVRRTQASVLAVEVAEESIVPFNRDRAHPEHGVSAHEFLHRGLIDPFTFGTGPLARMLGFDPRGRGSIPRSRTLPPSSSG